MLARDLEFLAGPDLRTDAVRFLDLAYRGAIPAGDLGQGVAAADRVDHVVG